MDEKKYNSAQEEQEIQEYIKRFEGLTPYERLELMHEFNEFLLKFMTPEGKEFFKKSRLEKLAEY